MAVLNNSALVGASGKGGGALPQRSLRFNSADSSYLSKTFASAGNRSTWTFSCWIKRSKLGVIQRFFSGATATNDDDWMSLLFNASDQLVIGGYNVFFRTSNSVYRDCSAWYHIVVIADLGNGSNSLKLRAWVNNQEVTWSSTSTNPTTTGINSANNHAIGAEQGPNNGGVGSYFNGYLANIHFINGQALDPSAFAYTDPVTGRWEPKAYAGSYSGNSFYLDFSDDSAATATALGADRSGLGNNWVPNNLTVPPSSSFSYTNTTTVSTTGTGSVVNKSFAFDGDLSTYAGGNSGGGGGGSATYTFSNTVPNRTVSSQLRVYVYVTPNLSIYVNGGASYVQPWAGTYQNAWVDLTSLIGIGNSLNSLVLTNYDPYDSQYRLFAIEVNGQQWIDSSVAHRLADTLRDHPVSAGIDGGLGGQVSGNYCTLNPLHSQGATLSNGNLQFATSSIGKIFGTIAVNSGKWYWESQNLSSNSLSSLVNGVGLITGNPNTWGGGDVGDYAWLTRSNTGSPSSAYNNGTITGYGNIAVAQNAVVGTAFDADNGTLEFFVNGISQGVAWSNIPVGSGRFYAPISGDPNSSTDTEGSINFGQRAFAYPVSGFKALCDTNMTQPTIVKPATVMGIVQYTGNSGTQTITGLNFNPDLIWSKSRSGTFGHGLFDSVRGVSRALASHSFDGEGVGAIGTGVTAFNSNGFSLGPDSGAFTGSINYTGSTQVAWCWDAGSTAMPKVYGAAASVSNTAALATTLISTASPSTVGNSYQNYDIDLQVSVTSAQIKFTYAAGPIETLVSADGTTWISKGSANQSAGATATVTHSSAFRYIRYCYSGGNWNQGFQFINNTSGSINSTALVNASAGFSIVGYTGNGSSGATVGHGGLVNLDKGMIIIKKRTSSPGNTNWRVYHSALGNTQAIYLSDTGAASAGSGFWNNTSPTSTVFTLGSDDGLNASGQTHIAYCFAPVTNYSSFGSYVGNGSADGPFQWCGFRPRWILIKSSSNAEDWKLYDTARDSYNLATAKLYPNLSAAENGSSGETSSTNTIDVLSNGFKMRTSNSGTNASAATYVWAAFAESPFQYARAR